MCATLKQKKVVEKPISDGKGLVKRNEKGQLLPGSILNPEGKKYNKRDFITDFNEVVEEYAQENNISFEEARKNLIKVGLTESVKKKFPFWKEMMNKYYGELEPEKPKQELHLHLHQEKILQLVQKAEEEIKKELEK